MSDFKRTLVPIGLTVACEYCRMAFVGSSIVQYWLIYLNFTQNTCSITFVLKFWDGSIIFTKVIHLFSGILKPCFPVECHRMTSVMCRLFKCPLLVQLPSFWIKYFCNTTFVFKFWDGSIILHKTNSISQAEF